MRRTPLLSFAVLLLACDKPAEPPATDTKAPAAKAESKDASKAEVEPATDTEPPVAADANAEVGKSAPDFTLTDIDGKAHTLSAYRGKSVVLEWFNPQCPFVRHAHTEGTLVSMAKDETAKGVVWLAINSGAPGKQGHGPEANTKGKTEFGLEHPILLDETGAVGHAYGAEKTPHVFLIDPSGTLLYRGAIDNAPFGEVDGGGETVNYLGQALEAQRAGQAVGTPETPAYGCTVKYG